MWSVVTDPVISPLDRLHFAHMHAYAMKHEGFFLRKKKTCADDPPRQLIG
jgi:hypothetical protein